MSPGQPLLAGFQLGAELVGVVDHDVLVDQVVLGGGVGVDALAIRVEAQNLTRAGIDEAFFGYWAIEEHHTEGIAKATFTPPA